MRQGKYRKKINLKEVVATRGLDFDWSVPKWLEPLQAPPGAGGRESSRSGF